MDSNSECQAIATTMSQENKKDGNYSDISISISQAEYSMSQNAKNANSQETSFQICILSTLIMSVKSQEKFSGTEQIRPQTSGVRTVKTKC